MRAFRSILAFASAFAVTAIAQEQPRPTPAPQPQPQPQQPRPAPTEDPARKDVGQTEKDKDKERLAQPGPEHRNLRAFVGTWQISGQCTKEGTQPETVSGTCNSELVLGDRFVQTKVNVTEGGKTIEGIGMCGYNNAQKQYVTTWQDTECTGIKMETGSYEPGTKTFTYTGEFKDETGKSVRCRRLVKIVSDNEHLMTYYMTGPDKPEQKVAEMTFKRVTRTAEARNP